MLKIIQNLCKITILSLSFSVINTGMITLSYAAQDQVLNNETIPPILQTMNLAIEEKLNTDIMELYQTQHWQEIVDKSPEIRTQLAADIRKSIGFSDDTFHILGQAYLNKYHMDGINTTDYKNQAIQFFSYCAGIFPYTINPSTKGYALIWAWLGVFYAIDKLPDSRIAFNKAVDLYPQLDGFFKEYIDVIFPDNKGITKQASHNELNLPAIYYLTIAESIFQSKNWEKAAEFFEIGFKIATIQSQPITLFNYMNAGHANFNMKNWIKTSKYLNKALELILCTPDQIPTEDIKKIQQHVGVADLNLIIEEIAKM